MLAPSRPWFSGPAVVGGPNGRYLNGGRHVGGVYEPPDPNQIDWVTLASPIQFNNLVADGKLDTIGQNIQYLGDTAVIDSAFALTANQGQLFNAQWNNFRVRDHVAWGPAGNCRATMERNNVFFLKPTAGNNAPGRIFDRDDVSQARFNSNYATGGGGFKVGAANNGYYECNRNQFLDIDGRRAEPSTQKPSQWQYFQIVGENRTNLTGRTSWNEVRNTPEGSRMEDGLNLYYGDYLWFFCEHNLIDGTYFNVPNRETLDTRPNTPGQNDYDSYAGGGLLSEGARGPLKFRYNTLLRCANYSIGMVNSYSYQGQEAPEMSYNTIVNGGVHREGLYAGEVQLHANVGIQCYANADRIPVWNPAWNKPLVAHNKIAAVSFHQTNRIGNPDDKVWRRPFVLPSRNDLYTPGEFCNQDRFTNQILCNDGTFKILDFAETNNIPRDMLPTLAMEEAAKQQHFTKKAEAGILTGPASAISGGSNAAPTSSTSAGFGSYSSEFPLN
ncbi:hypothetical protein ACW9KT_15635 [Hymenobacter sp. HD11105]